MRLFASLFLVAAVGCSQSDTGNKSSDMSQTSGGGGGNVDMAGGGGGGGSGKTVTLTTQTFKVPAGGEVFMCQDFANPFGGVDTDVQEWDSHMSAGSHHLLLFYKDAATNGSIAPCSGLEFSPTPYGAQQPDAQVVYPDGIGALIKGTQGFHLNMHYLNATQAEITAQVTITIHAAAPGSVTTHAGVFFFNNVSGIHVPSGQMQMVSATCTFPIAVNMLYGLAHMHQFSTNMTATINGQTIYSTDSWSGSPLQKYAPAMALPAGTQVTWTSTIDNTTGNTLTFGESAMTNEMSIFDGQYYPADPDNPTIDCEM